MIYPGLVSVTFRQLSAAEIIELVSSAGLLGIEWGGDVHVPVGQLDNAANVRDKTITMGLKVAAYGSYYRVGISEDNGLHFDDVLKTALALGAPVIRVWAGDKNSQDVDKAYREKVISEGKRIAKMAADYDIDLVFEFHADTLTNTYESAVNLLECIDQQNFFSYWQPINGAGVDKNCDGLDILIPWIKGVHCFHWWPDHTVRHPLEDGWEHWKYYYAKLCNISMNIYSLIEFVADNEPQNFLKDAKTLKKWLNKCNSLVNDIDDPHV